MGSDVSSTRRFYIGFAIRLLAKNNLSNFISFVLISLSIWPSAESNSCIFSAFLLIIVDLNASSIDENIVVEMLLNKNHKDYPDLAIIVSDVENLKRNLVLFTQVKDLKIPIILAINMSDRMKYKGIELDLPYLENQLHTKIILTTNRTNSWIDELKNIISNYNTLPSNKFMDPKLHAPPSSNGTSAQGLVHIIGFPT